MIASTRTTGLALAGVVALALAIRVWIAAHAWFVTDDFYFLRWVQSPLWSIGEVFLPNLPREIDVYRPLGLDLYFYVNFAAFGWNAFGYYLSGIALQLLAAAVMYRLARQEGYEPSIAWLIAAILAVGGPSLSSTYAVAEHNYLCVTVFYCLSVSFFLEYARTRRARFQVASCLALLLGLWSNDLAVTVVPLLLVVTWARSSASNYASRAQSTLALVWPQITLAAVFVDFRLTAVQWRQRNWFYEPDFGPDMLSNSLGNLMQASGGGYRLLLFAALGLIALLLRTRSKPPVLGIAWLVLGLAPFAVLAFPASRFGLALLPAVALCLGEIARAVVAPLKSPRYQSAALIGFALASVPWERAVDRIRDPGAEPQRHVYSVVRATLPSDPRSCVTVLCGGDDLASPAECAALRNLTFGGSLFGAVVPHRALTVEFDDARVQAGAFIGRDCLTYELRADRSLAVSERGRRPDDRAELSQLR